jgi:hypothetical protein
MSDIQEKMAKALAELGAFPEEVAANLAKLGIRGKQDVTSHCPVANYLRKAIGQPVLGVGETKATAISPYNHVTTLDLPDAIREFVERFDAGEFKELRADR